MANIIPFPKVDDSDRQVRTGGCHVLIFPGVRIERHNKPKPKPGKRAVAKPRRKVGRRGDRTGT